MTVTRGKTIPYVDDTITKKGKTIPYVDDTITKKVMANVNATSFGVQSIWMSTSCSKIIKSKHIAGVHVYESERDIVSKYDIKTQPPLLKTEDSSPVLRNQFCWRRSYYAIQQGACEPSLNRF